MMSLSDEAFLKNVLEKTVDLLESAVPIQEHGCEVCEYVIPAEKYLQALHSITAFRNGAKLDIAGEHILGTLP